MNQNLGDHQHRNLLVDNRVSCFGVIQRPKFFSPENCVYMKSQFAFPQWTNKTDYIAKQHEDVSFCSHLQHSFSLYLLPADFSLLPNSSLLLLEA